MALAQGTWTSRHPLCAFAPLRLCASAFRSGVAATPVQLHHGGARRHRVGNGNRPAGETLPCRLIRSRSSVALERAPDHAGFDSVASGAAAGLSPPPCVSAPFLG